MGTEGQGIGEGGEHRGMIWIHGVRKHPPHSLAICSSQSSLMDYSVSLSLSSILRSLPLGSHGIIFTVPIAIILNWKGMRRKMDQTLICKNNAFMV